MAFLPKLQPSVLTQAPGNGSTGHEGNWPHLCLRTLGSLGASLCSRGPVSQQKHGLQACGHILLSCPLLRDFGGSEVNEGLSQERTAWCLPRATPRPQDSHSGPCQPQIPALLPDASVEVIGTHLPGQKAWGWLASIVRQTRAPCLWESTAAFSISPMPTNHKTAPQKRLERSLHWWEPQPSLGHFWLPPTQVYACPNSGPSQQCLLKPRRGFHVVPYCLHRPETVLPCNQSPPCS